MTASQAAQKRSHNCHCWRGRSKSFLGRSTSQVTIGVIRRTGETGGLTYVYFLGPTPQSRIVRHRVVSSHLARSLRINCLPVFTSHNSFMTCFLFPPLYQFLVCIMIGYIRVLWRSNTPLARAKPGSLRYYRTANLRVLPVLARSSSIFIYPFLREGQQSF